MSKILLEMEKQMSRAEIAENITKIAKGIEKGNVKLSAGEDSVNLEPNDGSEFEIKVEEEQDGELSLELEVEWMPGEKEQDDIEIE